MEYPNKGVIGSATAVGPAHSQTGGQPFSHISVVKDLFPQSLGIGRRIQPLLSQARDQLKNSSFIRDIVTSRIFIGFARHECEGC
jgi:hypothetical protein